MAACGISRAIEGFLDPLAPLAVRCGRGDLWVSRLAALNLNPPASLVEIIGSGLLGVVAHLDVIDHALGARGFSHARGRTLVLHDIRRAVPIGDAALDVDLMKTVCAAKYLKRADLN